MSRVNVYHDPSRAPSGHLSGLLSCGFARLAPRHSGNLDHLLTFGSRRWVTSCSIRVGLGPCHCCKRPLMSATSNFSATSDPSFWGRRSYRQLWKFVAASVAAAFALATALIAAPNANAFIPWSAEGSAATGLEPTVTANLSHGPGTPSGAVNPIPGDTFTSTATFTLNDMDEPGVDHDVVIRLRMDPNTPWTSTPTAANFSGLGGAPTLTNCSTTACTATFSDITSNGTITFTHQAQVISDAPEGVLVAGTADVEVITRPEVNLEFVSERFIPEVGNSCTGTYEYIQRVSDGGAWLMDMHFADGAGRGLVQIDGPDTTIYPHYAAPAGSRNTVRVTDVNGNDITADIFANNPQYISPDPSPPYFPGDLIQTSYPNARWLDSLNWNYDAAAWTGDTWMPAGSTITVTRGITYQNCVDGYSTDFIRERPFGVSIEMARLDQTIVNTTDVDGWNLPGDAIGLPCETTMYWTQGRTAGGAGEPATRFGWFEWPNGTSTTRTPAQTGSRWVTDGIAVSRQAPEKIVYGQTNIPFVGSRTQELRVFDSITGQTTQLPAPGGSTGGIANLAFDADGNLWIVNDVTGRLYQMMWNGTALSGTWIDRGLPSPGMTGGDIAFDLEGNLYSLVSSGQIVRYPASTLTGGSGSRPAGTVAARFSGSDYYGLAFGADGRALVANYGGTIFAVDLTQPATTTQTPVRIRSGFSPNNRVTDLANCIFPGYEPEFAVQKSVVNRDGTISAPGTTGQPVTVGPNGVVTVNYVVTVRNTSTVTGTHAAITDAVTLPPGFSITDVRLDGVSQGASGTFTIPAVELAADESASYVVTVVGRAADLTAVNWDLAGTCDTAGAGNPAAGGFFNLVTMADDSDGPDNNDACVTVTPPPTAQLALVKEIHDSTGTHLVGNPDSRFFTLTAGPDNATALLGATAVVGQSPTSGAIAADRQVIAGTYILSEQGNDGGATSGTYTPGDWTCVDRNDNRSPVDIVNGAVTVDAGDNVECMISNSQPPPPAPAIELTKTANRIDNWVAGQTVTYTFVATNTGDVTLYNVVIEDDVAAFTGSGAISALTCDATDPVTLATGESLTCTATYVVTEADVDQGSVFNAADTFGDTTTDPDDPTNTPVTDDDDETVFPVEPAISLTKTADRTEGWVAGQTVTYTFVSTNTGDVTLYNVTITDDVAAFTGSGDLSALSCDASDP
ncbi:MAG: hypothetical protein Q4G67_05120, partial [Actinomycetia bacterium]|nr:hypothetical protein [Actinomycetes bacterium]